MIIDYIERYKNLFGVEPICTALTKSGVPIAPSTFYAARTRPASARALRDEELKPEIARVHQENYGVYGIRKMHAQLAREQVLAGAAPVARCTTRRLMKALGLKGISRAKGPRTTVAGTGPDTRPDLVKRAFTANAPNQLWVADITYVRTFAGWVYCAFVLDVFSRRVVGWQVSTSLRTDLALDALNMGLWTRAHDGHDTTALVHHSDRGVQYVAVRYTERLAEAGAVASVGSKGDSYRQRDGRGLQLFVQSRTRPKPRTVERHRRPRGRRRRVHRLVQLPPTSRRDRARPTRRIRNPAPQHNPPRATCSAGVRTLHQTRYLTLPITRFARPPVSGGCCRRRCCRCSWSSSRPRSWGPPGGC